MKKIGLTAGKSSVIKILKEASIPVLDCDQINAELLQKGNKGYQALIKQYGQQICDEETNIDKVKMSHMMFHHPQIKKEIEAILHPLIKQSIQNKLETLESDIAVVEVPLLFEVHWEDAFDEIWVVSCEESLLLERLEKYRNVSKEEAKRRLAHQIPQAEKCAKADVVLMNNQDLQALKRQVWNALGRDVDAQ